ncbi:CTP synthase [Candidatus Parcubacteria bacterium]|nr:CTP synthase [Candidatus Parcubacteria bacterium]
MATRKKRKYIFVVGGVMSGVGKGIASSSIGTVLKARGLNVTALKIDPYINVDAGTMNPTEHGEVFVLDDGDETDQDMGNYERFFNTTLSRVNYMTTGRVYLEVIRKERNLEYKGKNVEVVPDIPFEVIRRIEKATEKADADVTIIEIGGTIGEYQNIIFLEAARMMKSKNPQDVAFVMVSYLPIPSKVGEMKTKPTQYAARTLNGVGIQADIIIARSEVALDHKRKEKIALFCNIQPESVISAPDIDSIYDVPVNFERDNLGAILCKTLKIPSRPTNLSAWKSFVKKSKSPSKEVKIGVVGKYFDSGDFVLSDVYISVLEALKISAYHLGAKPVIDYINSKDFEGPQREKNLQKLKEYHGILVPGGFGSTGIEGKINAIQFAREKKIPYFGLCYGMQLLVIEYARNVARLKGAHTTEVDPKTKYPVIDIMEDQKKHMEKGSFGATMRLGAYPAHLKKETVARSAYNEEMISERHRHRYEVNPKYIPDITKAGLVFSGTSPDGRLMEIAELPERQHPFFLGTQFHPEFTARPLNPHPLFTRFLEAALKRIKPPIKIAGKVGGVKQNTIA